VSANATGLFTHAGGIQAIAANGPVSLQAHTDQLEILADKAITVISVNDVIEIKANQKIVLQAGQSSVTLEGGNITFACPGNFTVKGGQHVFDGGTSQNAKLTELPHALVTPKPQPYSMRWATVSAVTGKLVADVDVIALDAKTKKQAFNGITQADGRSPRQRDENAPKEFTVFAGSGEWITEIRTDEEPQMLEHDDWMDWEAEE
jgi:type VI secretion system secreted protein VgrG